MLKALRDADDSADPQPRLAVDPVLGDVLGWLWTTVAEPVLTALGLVGARDELSDAENRHLPRLWWSPTGPLSLLPLHAAGLYAPSQADTDPEASVFDRVVSSYATTLGALLRSREQASKAREEVRLLGVDMTGEMNVRGDQGRSRELSAVGRRVPISTLLQDEHVTGERVLTELATHDWAHLACHGLQGKMAEPDSAHLVLHDGPLTMLAIAELDLPDAEFAFLSACQTFAGSAELHDEALHLAAGFHLAGFAHVIATQWSINAFHAPGMADAIYSRLATPGGADASRAARAVHDAVRELRARRPHWPQLWAAYVHAGP